MSKEISTMHTKEGQLQFTQFWNGWDGMSIQLTQGTGGHSTPGYIQLTQAETESVVARLQHWLQWRKLEEEDADTTQAQVPGG